MMRNVSIRSFALSACALAALAGSAAADRDRACQTRAECTKHVACKPGYGLMATGHSFVCKKVSTKVTDQQPLTCAKGLIKSVDGADYCEWTAVQTPDCDKHGGFDDWEWRKAKKQCRRLGNDGQEHFETANIACASKLSFNASSGKCEGTVRDGWSVTEAVGACTTQLPGSVYLQDFVGNGDRCAKVEGETDFKAPTLQ